MVWDGLLAAFIASAAASAILMVFPQAMFPAGDIRGAEWLLPLVIFGIAGADVALAALAYRHDVASTVHVRAIVEPWVISIAAGALAFTYFVRDGLIIAYVVSVVAGLATAFWRLIASYGVPRGWRPNPAALLAVARRNVPLAAADAIEWGSRRLDIAILGLFVAPYWVGVYYVAQQVASMPQKLKTSFDPILAPVITQKLAEGDRKAVAKQVRQVGFWIIAAQAAIALALGIPGEAVMGLVGHAVRRRHRRSGLPARRRGGGGDRGRVRRRRWSMSPGTAICSSPLLMLATQALLTVADHPRPGCPALACGRRSAPGLPGGGRGARLCAGARHGLGAEGAPALAAARRAGAGLALAAGLGRGGGDPGRLRLHRLAAGLEWIELAIGIAVDPARLRLVVWMRGFTHEDRALFRMKKDEEPSLPVTDIATP